MSTPLQKPSINSVRVPSRMERFSKKRSTLDGTVSAMWFARFPGSVVLDKRLSSDEKMAYAVIALGVHAGSEMAPIGMRLLGWSVGGKSPVTAARWVAKLEECGHIRREKGANGARNKYHLTSPVFGRSAVPSKLESSGSLAEGRDVPVSGSSACCANCKRIVKSLGNSGYCRTCVNDANRLRQWEAAKAELGPLATEEQIVHHLQIRKLTASWRKVMKRAQAA